MQKISGLIIKGERILQLDLRYFLRGGFFLGLRQLVTGLSGFLVSLFLTRQFSKYTFGEYSLMLSLFNLLAIFSLPGMMDAILNAVVGGFDKSLIEGTKLRFKASFLSIPAFLLLAIFYFWQEKPTISLLLLLSLPLFPFYFTFRSYEVFLTAKESFFKLFWINSLVSLITAGVVVINTLIFKKIYLTFFSLVFTAGILDFLFYLYVKKPVRLHAKSDPEMKKFGYFLTLRNLLSLIVENLDKVLLGFFTGFSAIAVFSVANLVPQFMEKSLYALQAVFLPKIIKQGQKGNLLTIKKHLFKIILLSIFIFLLVFSTLPFFIKIFFGPKYEDSIILAQALSLSLIFFLASGLLNQMIIFQKRKESILFFSLYPALPKMALYLLLIPRFGVWGLVLSLVISKILGFIGLLWVSLKND